MDTARRPKNPHSYIVGVTLGFGKLGVRHTGRVRRVDGVHKASYLRP